MTFADVVDPLGGWFQPLVQTGCFGLLTFIIVWMYPRAVKSERDEREKRDKMFSDIILSLETGFATRSKELAVGIKEQTTVLTAAIERNGATVTQAMQAVCKAQLRN